jgi:hypothetical protein
MIMLKRFCLLLLVGVILVGGFEFVERYLTTGVPSFVSNAEAVVGRPLTPVSVSGVARRTARRTVSRY